MRIILVALVLLAGLLSPLTAAASDDAGSPPDTTGEAPIYLALGDSLAAGFGASIPWESGYVPLLHSALKDRVSCAPGGEAGCPALRLVNLAEFGATTTSLMQSQLPRAIALIEGRNNDNDPGNDVVAITIDIGGNDAVRELHDLCGAEITTACGHAVQPALAVIGSNLIAILTQLRAAAGPDTSISIMTYYNSFLDCDQPDTAVNANLLLEGLYGLFPGLNDMIRLAAELSDTSVAETFGLLDATDLAGGTDCLHANDAGYRKVADAFIATFGTNTGFAVVR